MSAANEEARSGAKRLATAARSFAWAWVAGVVTCQYGLSGGGTVYLNHPVALCLWLAAVPALGLVGRRWRPRGALLGLALCGPGALAVVALAGALGDPVGSGLAAAVSSLGPWGLGVWLLGRWGRESVACRRKAWRLGLAAGVLAVAGAGLGAVRAAVTPESGWSSRSGGSVVVDVPLEQVSSLAAAALIATGGVVAVAALFAIFGLPAALAAAPRDFLEEEPARRGSADLELGRGRAAARRGALVFVTVGLVGTAAVYGSSLVVLPVLQLPGWPLAALPWAAAALLAAPVLETAGPVAAGPEGVLADGRREPWSAFAAWDVRADRFVLHAPDGTRRTLPLAEDDPHRATVEAWIQEAGLPRAGLPKAGVPTV